MGPYGGENFKTLLLYSFSRFATKLLLQTPHGGPHKMFFLEFWHFEFVKKFL